MKIIDLTHTISEEMPVFPGTEKPLLKTANSYEIDGFKETLLTMFSHTGTHMDAPAHLFEDGSTLDSLPVSHFVGSAVVVNCTMLSEGERITMDQIRPIQKQADSCDFLLFHLGWDQYWGRTQYFGNYPYIDEEVTQYILQTNKKGVGLDVIGIDPIEASDLPIHKKLLQGRDMVIIENLTNLHLLGSDIFTFYALPMKFENSDGAPVRAIGVLK